MCGKCQGGKGWSVSSTMYHTKDPQPLGWFSNSHTPMQVQGAFPMPVIRRPGGQERLRGSSSAPAREVQAAAAAAPHHFPRVTPNSLSSGLQRGCAGSSPRRTVPGLTAGPEVSRFAPSGDDGRGGKVGCSSQLRREVAGWSGERGALGTGASPRRKEV